jgi:hypothetical protein
MRTRLLASAAFIFVVSNCTPVNDSEPDGTGGSGSATGGKSGGGSGGSHTGGGGTGGSASTGGAGGSGSGSGGSSASGGSNGGGGSSASGGATGGSGSGTGGSAGTPDGGDGDVPAAPAGCTAKFCEDFEGQTAGQEPKSAMYSVVKAQTPMMTVDTTKFWSGKQSLKLGLSNAKGDTKAQLAFTAPLLPMPENDVHGRMMVWLSKNPGNHWDLATAFGTDQPMDDDNLTQYTLGSMSGHLMAVYQPGDDSVDSSTQLPAGKWVCLEWEFKGAADGTHLIRLQMDGMLINKGEITKGGIAKGDWKATTWKSMKVGFIVFSGVAGAFDMWIDDVAVSDKPIGCPPMK